MGHCEDIVTKTPTEAGIEWDCFSCNGNNPDCVAYVQYDSTCSKYLIAKQDLKYYEAGRLDKIRFFSMLKRHLGVRGDGDGKEREGRMRALTKDRNNL